MPAGEGVDSCAVSLDGRVVVSGSVDRSLKVWDSVTGLVLRKLLGHEGAVRGCAVSRDGRYIISASADNSVGVWDAQSGIRVSTFTGHRDWVNSCAINGNSDFSRVKFQ